jgi:hypothetical protein
VFLRVFPDARQVNLGIGIDLGKYFRITDARELENLFKDQPSPFKIDQTRREFVPEES